MANTLIAVIWAYSINRWMATSSLLGVGTDLGVLILCAALFAGSRDSLTKYYARTSRLIGQAAEKGSEAMTNGNHHEGGGTASTKPRPEAKPESKPGALRRPEQNKPQRAQSPK